MFKVLHAQTPTDPAAEAHRHAYNAAFEELGLNWHWDASTYTGLSAHGRDGLRAYLQNEQSHLLRAYEADFLVDAIEAAKARRYASGVGNRAYATPYVGRTSDSLTRCAA